LDPAAENREPGRVRRIKAPKKQGLDSSYAP
jgi:hypothetical protein